MRAVDKVRRYKWNEKVKIKLAAEDWEVITSSLYKSCDVGVLGRVLDQLCGNKDTWGVSHHGRR